MLNATVHVLLVSDQAAPNLLPTLDPDLNPKEAILLVSAKMRARADALESVLKEAGVETSRVELDDEHDFARIENALMEVAAARTNDRVALNVTGGTKLMALAAQSVASAAGWEVFYVDLDTDEAIVLGKAKRRKKLSTRLGLSHYLGAYGYRAEKAPARQQPNERCMPLVTTLVRQIGSLEAAIGQLNRLAQIAEDGGALHVALSARQADSLHLQALLRNFEEAGVLGVDDDAVRFASAADRSFAGGGWLEYYVYRTLAASSADLGIRDKATNLCVVDNAGVKSELDVAFMARNRLFVIECKTARMDGSRAAKANDTLFKLSEVCRRVGGLGTQAMLASYRPLREAEQDLARALHIEIVAGSALAQLDHKLKAWVME
jgi:hypothetical protein